MCSTYSSITEAAALHHCTVERCLQDMVVLHGCRRLLFTLHSLFPVVSTRPWFTLDDLDQR